MARTVARTGHSVNPIDRHLSFQASGTCAVLRRIGYRHDALAEEVWPAAWCACEMPLRRRYSVETLCVFDRSSQVQRDRLGHSWQWLEAAQPTPGAKSLPVIAVRLERVGRLGLPGEVLGLVGDRFEARQRSLAIVAEDIGIIGNLGVANIHGRAEMIQGSLRL
jgi:hypothetical protein